MYPYVSEWFQHIILQTCVTLRRAAVTGSSRPTMTSTGSDSRAPPSTPTLGQTATTLPTRPRVITTTCPPLLLTAPARKLGCLHRCTPQVRPTFSGSSVECLNREHMRLKTFEYSVIAGLNPPVPQISFLCLINKTFCSFDLLCINFTANVLCSNTYLTVKILSYKSCIEHVT